MGAVDFYLLDPATGKEVLTLACKVAAKAWKNGFRVFVLAADHAQCETLDELLWTYSQGAFVPHALDGQQDDDDPVVIGSAADRCPAQAAVVVSLHREPLGPAFHHLRIADIIGASEAERAEARERFRFYRDNGMEPGMHRL